MAGLPQPAATDIGWATWADDVGNDLNGWVLDETLNAATGVMTTAATWASGTTFTVTGDQTPTYVQGRRLRIVHAGGTTYCQVASSVFGAVTTVTIGTITSGPAALTAAITSVAYGSNMLGATGNLNVISASTNLATADVPFSTGVAGTYNDGPGLTLGTGSSGATWLLIGAVEIIVATVNQIGTAKLWDGTTVLASGDFIAYAAGANGTIPVVGFASSSGTWKISAAASVASTGNVIKFQSPSGANGNPANVSYLRAIRLT